MNGTGHEIETHKEYTYDDAVELAGHGRYNYFLLSACCIISTAFALDIFGLAIVVAASSCDLRLGIRETGILNSAPFAGVLFAYPWGYYADTRGRRRALLLSTGFGFLFALISSFAASWQYLLAAKLLGSSFSSASFTLAMTYLGECTNAQHRGQYLLLLMAFNFCSELVSFNLAAVILPLEFAILIPWLGIVFRSWRLYTQALALPLGIGAFMMYFLYESPKFLANRGEISEALDILKKCYVTNGGKMEDYPVQGMVITEDACDGKMSFWSSLSKHTVPIFKPPLLWRTLQLFFLLALCCAVNNAFFMWYPTMVNIFFKSMSEGWSRDKSFCERISNFTSSTELEDPSCKGSISDDMIYSGIALSLFLVAVNLAVMKVAHRRRLILIMVQIVPGISGLFVDINHPILSLIFFMLIQTTALGIGCLASYFVDMYPTSCRSTASSLGMSLARITSFFATHLIDAVITHHCALCFYCASAFLLCGIITTLFLPADKKTRKEDDSGR